jgi:hypothetical protein
VVTAVALHEPIAFCVRLQFVGRRVVCWVDVGASVA